MNPRYLFRKAGGIAALCLVILMAAMILPAANAFAISTVAVQAADTVHVVQRGDTLAAIARRYGTTVQALMSYNSLRTTTIYVGQRILIPTSQPDPTYPITHVVQAGDTLAKIAARYGTTVQALMQVNNLRSTIIYVGQRLTISVAVDPNAPMIEYFVQRGDTLNKLAQRFDVTVQAIMAANGLRTTTIYVGQRLLIPQSLGYPTPTPTPGRARIQFAPGATSATVAGRVTFPNRREYVLRAQAGQQMHVELTSDNSLANFAITGLGDGQPLKRLENSDTVWTGTLPGTQDYLIQIATLEGSSPGYSLFVEITPLPSQDTTERIQFAAGATGTTVTGTVTDPAHRKYLVRAQAGQTMNVTLNSAQPTTSFSVVGVSGGQVLKALGSGSNSWSGLLPQTQDYLIEIVTLEFSSTAYGLTVEIPSLPAQGTTERIQFAAGATAATVTNYTSAIEPRSYLLNARAGQTMTVALSVDNANVYITVRNPSGENLAGSDGPIHNWTGVLPINGDYIVEVLNPGTGLANFSLTVTIQ
ncbi:MAG: LysM peptidoglycan-binding domain-containing protein [Caldilineaceae bacterium]